MDVYVLGLQYSYEGQENRGVFSSWDAAKAAYENGDREYPLLDQFDWTKTHYFIEVWNLDDTENV